MIAHCVTDNSASHGTNHRTGHFRVGILLFRLLSGLLGLLAADTIRLPRHAAVSNLRGIGGHRGGWLHAGATTEDGYRKSHNEGARRMSRTKHNNPLYQKIIPAPALSEGIKDRPRN